jgi:hypothetical protein
MMKAGLSKVSAGGSLTAVWAVFMLRSAERSSRSYRVHDTF